MDYEKNESPKESKAPTPTPYVNTGGDGPIEVREPPPMYYGEVCGGGVAKKKKGKRSDTGASSTAPKEIDLYVEVDVDDEEAFDAEFSRLSRIFRVQRGLPPEEPELDEEELANLIRNQDPEDVEAFFSKREAEREAKRIKEGRTEEVVYSSEEVERHLRQFMLDHLRQAIANGQ